MTAAAPAPAPATTPAPALSLQGVACTFVSNDTQRYTVCAMSR